MPSEYNNSTDPSSQIDSAEIQLYIRIGYAAKRNDDLIKAEEYFNKAIRKIDESLQATNQRSTQDSTVKARNEVLALEKKRIEDEIELLH